MNGTVEDQLRIIQERNARVERDKAWEVSLTRRLTISAMIYVVAVISLWSLGVVQPFLHSLIPGVAYFFSTLSLPVVKRWWMKRMVP